MFQKWNLNCQIAKLSTTVGNIHIIVMFSMFFGLLNMNAIYFNIFLQRYLGSVKFMGADTDDLWAALNVVCI